MHVLCEYVWVYMGVRVCCVHTSVCVNRVVKLKKLCVSCMELV